MGINIETDELIGFKQRGKLPGPTPSANTFRNWMDVGIKRGDQRIRLANVRIGGRRYTTVACYMEFLRKTQDDGMSSAMDLT